MNTSHFRRILLAVDASAPSQHAVMSVGGLAPPSGVAPAIGTAG